MTQLANMELRRGIDLALGRERVNAKVANRSMRATR